MVVIVVIAGNAGMRKSRQITHTILLKNTTCKLGGASHIGGGRDHIGGLMSAGSPPVIFSNVVRARKEKSVCSVSCRLDANEPMRTHRNRTKDPPEAHERAFSLSVGTVDTTIVLACSLSFPLSEPPVNLPFT